MNKFVNWNRYSADGNRKPEPNPGVSMAAPDPGLTIKQLVERYMSGGKVKSFTPAPDELPDGLDRMDKIERGQLAITTAQFIKDTRGKLITARQAREQQLLEQQIEKRIQERLQQQQNNVEPPKEDK